MTRGSLKRASAIPMLPMRATGTSSHQLNQLKAVQEISQQTCPSSSLRSAAGRTVGRRCREEVTDGLNGFHSFKMSLWSLDWLTALIS